MGKDNPSPQMHSQSAEQDKILAQKIANNSKECLYLALHSSSPEHCMTEISRLCDESLGMLAKFDNRIIAKQETRLNLFLGALIRVFLRINRSTRLVGVLRTMMAPVLFMQRQIIPLKKSQTFERAVKLVVYLTSGKIFDFSRIRLTKQYLDDAEINLGCLEEMFGSEAGSSLQSAREKLIRIRTFHNLSVAKNPPKSFQIIERFPSEPSFVLGSRGSGKDRSAYDAQQNNARTITRQMDCEWQTLSRINFRSSGILEDGDKAYFFDSGLLPDNYWYRDRQLYWQAGERQEKTLLTLDTVKPETVIRSGIALPSRAPGNWFHWWFEVMHGVLLASPDIPASAPVIVRSKPPQKFVDIFNSFSGRQLLVLGVDLPPAIYLETAWTLPPALHTRDSFSPRHNNSVPFHDRNALEKIRTTVMRSVKLDHGPRKIFFKRNSPHRSLRNESQLVRLSREARFAIIDPTSLSLHQQVALMAGADAVVSAGGAIMANYLFAREEATIVQIVSPQNVAFSAPEVLCRISGAHLRTIEGKSESLKSTRNALSWQHSDFELDVRSFQSVLSSL